MHQGHINFGTKIGQPPKMPFGGSVSLPSSDTAWWLLGTWKSTFAISDTSHLLKEAPVACKN